LGVFLIAGSLAAGQPQFPLSFYNPPEIAYKKLEFSPHLRIGGTTVETSDDQPSTYDYDSQRGDVDVWIQHYQYVDRDNLQLSFDAYPGWSLSYNRSTHESVTERFNSTEQQTAISRYTWQNNINWDNRLSLNIGQNARWYPGKRAGGFASLDFRGTGAWNSINKHSPLDVSIENAHYGDSIVVEYQKLEDVTNIYTATAHLYLSGGAGRVNDVTYAAAALYIYEELGESRLLSRTPETSDIQALAALLNQRKERRVFDTRTARIDDIEAICTFLEKRGLIAEQIARAVMIVDDMYTFALNQRRESGVRFEVGPDGGFSYERRQLHSTKWQGRTIEDEEIMDNPRGIQDNPLCDSMPPDADEYTSRYTDWVAHGLVGVGLTCRKPTGRWWQFGISPASRLGIVYDESKITGDHEHSSSDTGTQVFYFMAHHLEGQVDCFLSTRTTVTAMVSGSWYGAFTTREDSAKGNAVEVYTRMGLEYYLSPRLRLGLGGDLMFEKSWGDGFTAPRGDERRSYVWYHSFGGTDDSHMVLNYSFRADLSLDIF